MLTRVFAFLALVALVACGEPQGDEGTTTTTPSDPVTSTTGAPATHPDLGTEIPEAIMNGVVSDAASRTGVEPSVIVVALAREVTWNDGSLGCPEPGEMYTQALIYGYQVVLIAGDEALDYRIDDSGGFRVCEQPASSASEVSVPDPITPESADEVVNAAREDLSLLLDQPADSFVEEGAGFIGAPTDNPCAPPQLDRRDEASPRVQAYEVVLRSGQANYRYVAVEGSLHRCGVSVSFDQKQEGSRSDPSYSGNL